MNPEVSIIIPCRNEEKYIGKCLDSLISSDFPKERLEVLVVDGLSRDKTKEIIQGFSQKHPFIKLLENLNKFTPFGLNVGLKAAKGETIVRMDAHASYPKNYISQCLKHLKESGVDNVGGVIKTLPSQNTLSAKAIAISLSHPFGVGGSYFRKGSKQARLVDTVFGGCYKKEVFQKIGLFNDKLRRSQDIEFNLRLKKAGGKILLVPEIIAFYYPQPDFLNFLKHNFSDGIWTTFPLKFRVRIFSYRHLIPLLFVSGLIALLILGIFLPFFFWLFLFSIILYFLVAFYFALGVSFKEKNLSYLLLMPIAFAVRHFGYGLGSFFGLIKILGK